MTNNTILKTSSVNLHIIREIFKTIKPTEISMPDFYKFLADDENISNKELRKFEDGFNHAIQGNGNVKKFSRIFTEYGISEEYFIDTPIIAHADILTTFEKHSLDSQITTPDDCKQVLLENIFSVKNLDGTLVIDCIRNILWDMQHINKIDNMELYTLPIYIARLEPNSHLSKKQLNDYYENFDRKYKEDGIPLLPEVGTLSDKKIYSPKKNADKLYNTLFLIREIYLLFASIDEVEHPLEKFYAHINISEEEYNSMLENKQFNARKLLKTFEPYKFPASLFRGDSPADLNIDTDILYAIPSYDEYDEKIEDFRSLLRLYLCYRIDKKHIPVAMAVYSLYSEIIRQP